MKLVPYNGKIGGYYSRTSNYDMLKQFMDSGMKCAEVTDFRQKTANSAAASIRQTIKRYNLFNVYATARDGRLFIYRGEI